MMRLRDNFQVWCGRVLVVSYGLIAIAALFPHGADVETARVVCIELDKIIHFVGFAGLALLTIGATRGSGTFKRGVFVLLAVLFGVGIEALHYYLPYRTFNPVDIFANVCGVGFGVLVALKIERRRARKAERVKQSA
ncbi:MAG: VanZ family protein [Desulfobacteraceae bacterium]